MHSTIGPSTSSGAPTDLHWLGPDDLPDNGWRRIDVAAIWTSELLPLIERTPGLQQTLEAAIAYWNAGPDPDQPDDPDEEPWRWDDPDHTPPFLLGQEDDVVALVEERIQAAVAAKDPAALAHEALLTVLIGPADLDLPGKTRELLWKRASTLWRSFTPQRDDIRWVRPQGSSHYFAKFELALARAWRPDVDWAIAKSQWHAAVVSLRERLVFDIVMLADDDDPCEPVLYVKGTGAAIARQREDRERAKAARAQLRTAAGTDIEDEQDFAEFFDLYSADIAGEMGLEFVPGTGFSEEDLVSLEAECRAQWRSGRGQVMH